MWQHLVFHSRGSLEKQRANHLNAKAQGSGICSLAWLESPCDWTFLPYESHGKKQHNVYTYTHTKNGFRVPINSIWPFTKSYLQHVQNKIEINDQGKRQHVPPATFSRLFLRISSIRPTVYLSSMSTYGFSDVFSQSDDWIFKFWGRIEVQASTHLSGVPLY